MPRARGERGKEGTQTNRRKENSLPHRFFSQQRVFVTCHHVFEKLHKIQTKKPSAEIVAYLTSSLPGRTRWLRTYRPRCHARCRDLSSFGGNCRANEDGDRRFFHHDDPDFLGVNLGGLSGSPAFVIRDNQTRFAGIVTECSNTECSKDVTIFISRLGFLNPDGTLDHTAIPW